MSASISAGTFPDECLQRGRVDGIAFMEIDGTYRLAVQTCVEEALRILVLAVDAAKPTTRPPLPLEQLGLHALDVLAPRCRFLRPEHPAEPLVACKRGEVFPRREHLRVGHQDASQIHRDCMCHSAGYRLGPHRPLILARQLRAPWVRRYIPQLLDRGSRWELDWDTESRYAPAETGNAKRG